MYKFIGKMWNGSGLQGLTCWRASFWNLLGVRACLQFRVITESPCNSIKNVTYIYLLARDTHWVPYSPACYLRTLGLTYITPQSSLHSVPFTDISLFRDGNNPGKPFCTALLSLCSGILRLRSVRTQSYLCSCLQWSSTIQKPVELNRGSFAVENL